MTRSNARTRLVVAIGGCILVAACGLLDPTTRVAETDYDAGVPGGGAYPTDAFPGPDGQPMFGARVGEACEGDQNCRPSLDCDGEGTCQPTPDGGAGEACTVSGECVEGLACGFPVDCRPGVDAGCGFSECQESEGREEGEDCAAQTACGRGLRCNLIGFTGVCEAEGSTDAGLPCTDHSDCLDPLLCTGPAQQLGTTEFTCQLAAFSDVFMPDAECEEVAEDEAFRMYFEVPGDEPPSEFYRLPFPNDARLRNGRIDMSGHHNPGILYVGGAFVDLYLDAIENRLDGFSPNPTIFFRFSQDPDFGTVVGEGDNATIHFVNVDPESPNYGNRVAMRWTITTGRGKFICPRYLAVRPNWTSPLEHGTTYAIFFTNGVRSGTGDLPTVEPDFAAVLGGDAPGDQRLTHAWEAYAPLRDYLVDQGLPSDTLIVGTVFTTMDPDADLPAIRAGVRALAPPTLNDLDVCVPGLSGPCDDGERGACVNASGDFVEVHATYEAPILQAGTRPYLFAQDGGDLVFADGQVVSQGTETVCLSMTIPTAPMPDAGWPVSMYAHGTGGSFTSHIHDGTAGRVADIDLGDGDRAHMVSVGIDGTQHGPRRGDSDLSPETLFYNFVNPLAAAGNVQQGAADYFILTHLLENAEIDVPGIDETVVFDPQQMYFFGHSQGSTIGGLFVAYERDTTPDDDMSTGIRAAIFSGAGGSLVLSLLHKTNPEDIAGGVRFVLTDGGTTSAAVNDYDPLLSLLQMYIDPVDPLNYARLYFRNVDEGTTGVHIFQSFGYGETYTPEPNMEAFAKAMGVRLGTPYADRNSGDGPVDPSGFRTSDYPVSGNVAANGEPITGILVTANPDDYDGHFVIFREAQIRAQSMEFLGTAIRDGVPTVTGN